MSVWSEMWWYLEQCLYPLVLLRSLNDTFEYITHVQSGSKVHCNLYDDTSQYLPKTVLYFWKQAVLKVLCYQNIYAEKHGRTLHGYIFIGDNHGEWRPMVTKTYHRNLTKVLLTLIIYIRLRLWQFAVRPH